MFPENQRHRCLFEKHNAEPGCLLAALRRPRYRIKTLDVFVAGLLHPPLLPWCGARHEGKPEARYSYETVCKPTNLHGRYTEMCQGVMKQWTASTRRGWLINSQTGLRLPERFVVQALLWGREVWKKIVVLPRNDNRYGGTRVLEPSTSSG